MTDEEKKAIEWLKYMQETREEQIRQQAWVGTNTFDAIDIILNLIEKQQAEIDKKDVIINEMAEQLSGLAIWNNDIEEALILGDTEEVIEYFTNKVEGA